MLNKMLNKQKYGLKLMRKIGVENEMIINIDDGYIEVECDLCGDNFTWFDSSGNLRLMWCENCKVNKIQNNDPNLVRAQKKPLDKIITITGVCKECKTEFEKLRNDTQYCSERCKQRAERARRKLRERTK